LARGLYRPLYYIYYAVYEFINPSHELILTTSQRSIAKTYENWKQNICKPGLRNSKRGRWKGQRGDKTPYALSLPSLYFGWLDANVCICNGQRSSEISCDKYSPKYVKYMQVPPYQPRGVVGGGLSAPLFISGSLSGETKYRCSWMVSFMRRHSPPLERMSSQYLLDIIWTRRRREKIFAYTRNQTLVVQPAALTELTWLLCISTSDIYSKTSTVRVPISRTFTDNVKSPSTHTTLTSKLFQSRTEWLVLYTSIIINYYYCLIINLHHCKSLLYSTRKRTRLFVTYFCYLPVDNHFTSILRTVA
jgi:hypothetical protein